MDIVQNQCYCEIGYYEQENEQDCQLCPIGCQQCISQNYCQNCKGLQRILNDNQCVCQNGFYDDNLPDCKVCSLYCKTCTGFEVCTSCYGIGRYLTSFQTCNCIDGYYESLENSSVDCLVCPIGCSICSSHEECQECQGNARVLINDQCECSMGMQIRMLKLQIL
ncbi:Insulin-like growth factor binding protein, N-terminal [Pseudocohnilembus persalinus]|uniref:Insulin-like growth factor binding protein, N-terminal n=1 Tax=Pseudocohnilembus persalinus TaxID=266149 RepID=A0A0V0QUQ6_PSEPJ|nr:Insulin-like growth factor binding protein, N-terminal [Pseudocohnilembus persalinus]|eukprot:KRX06092.1 Insulin-like growth factor binding protein, N-terminal [Pseudocohnilembus persalinus]